MQVIYMEMTQDWAKSNVAKWNLMGGTIQACETLPTVHVEQWLGMFWLEFGCCFHGTCLACAL